MKRKEAIKKLRNGAIQIFNDTENDEKFVELFLKAYPKNAYTVDLYINYKYGTKSEMTDYGFKLSYSSFDLPIIKLSSISKGKNKLKQLEKQFSELAKDVAEIKESIKQDWGDLVNSGLDKTFELIPSEHTKSLDVDFENVRTKLEKGNWYKNGNGETLFLYLSDSKRPGFNSAREWVSYIGAGCDDKLVLATPSEIEQALITEANKIGYKHHDKVIDLSVNIESLLENNYKIGFIPERNEFFYLGVVVFKDGLWSEIIEQKPINEQVLIDLSKPHILEYVGIDPVFLVQTTGNYINEETFEAIVIYSKNEKILVGEKIDYFSKEFFKLFKGTLTINQE